MGGGGLVGAHTDQVLLLVLLLRLLLRGFSLLLSLLLKGFSLLLGGLGLLLRGFSLLLRGFVLLLRGFSLLLGGLGLLLRGFSLLLSLLLRGFSLLLGGLGLLLGGLGLWEKAFLVHGEGQGVLPEGKRKKVSNMGKEIKKIVAQWDLLFKLEPLAFWGGDGRLNLGVVAFW